jgi:hypothetical protein
MTPLSQQALSIAISQIGKQETPIGSNWGDTVKEYLASVNCNHPAAWCMAFAYWCFKTGGSILSKAGMPVTLPPQTARCLDAWQKADAAHRITGQDPQPGDIFIMDLGNGLGHAGIVKELKGSGPGCMILTIDGNTNDTGSREGFEVELKKRYNQHPIIGYLRY